MDGQDGLRMIKHALGILLTLTLVAGCAPAQDEPALTDDCGGQENDSLESASALPAEDGFEQRGLSLCEHDVDMYSIRLEPGQFAYVEITFDAQKSDLVLDLFDEAHKRMDQSDSGLAYERVGILTPEGGASMQYDLAVYGYQGSTGTYAINVRLFEYEDGKVCHDDCYRIMQFPAPHADDHYAFDTPAEFRNIRRELIMLVRYALDETYKRYPGTKELGLIDMGERDGSTPGTAYNDLRHPEGTHVQGNDIDISYFQTSPDNHARPVCANDGYFCTSDTNTMDAEITAFFFAKLYESNRLRVIGVDTKLADDLALAADALLAEGAITAAERAKFDDRMAYGEGWPFHHHHFHVSLKWLDDDDVYESHGGALAPGGWDLDPYADFE